MVPAHGQRQMEVVMIGNKELHYTGKGTDLGALQSHIEQYLKADGFRVQASAPSEQGSVLQANKGGFLRGLVDADRALTITVTGSPADYTVRIGIGKWIEHLAVAVIRDPAHFRPVPGRRRGRDRLELRDRGQAGQGHRGVRRLNPGTPGTLIGKVGHG